MSPQIRELTTRCQRLREEAAAGSAAAAEEGRQAAALDARQAQLLGRCEDLARRIRELGSLSAEVFEKYQGKGVKVRGTGWLHSGSMDVCMVHCRVSISVRQNITAVWFGCTLHVFLRRGGALVRACTWCCCS